MKTDINNDLSKLTTISESTLTKLSTRAIWCISDAIERSTLLKESNTEIDIGIGTLIINTSNNEIKYRFIPNKKLEKAVAQTYLNERNCFTCNLETSLVSKMTDVYKDFF